MSNLNSLWNWFTLASVSIFPGTVSERKLKRNGTPNMRRHRDFISLTVETAQVADSC